MLPVIEPDGKSTTRHIVAFASTLIPISLFPVLLGMTGQIYLVGALVLGGCFLYYGVRVAMDRTKIPPGATGSPRISSVPSLDYGATRHRPARALNLRERSRHCSTDGHRFHFPETVLLQANGNPFPLAPLTWFSSA